MKNLGLAGAIALCGIGLILIGFGNFRTQTVYAAPAVAAVAASQDKGEPTIVWMDQTTNMPNATSFGSTVFFWRMWSDGRIEGRAAKLNSLDDFTCGDSADLLSCPTTSDWMELPPPPGGEGYACRSDVNGDRRVDGIDLATLLSQWGDGVSCDPQPSYDCLQLSNLNS